MMKRLGSACRRAGWHVGLCVLAAGLMWSTDSEARRLTGVRMSSGKKVVQLRAGVNSRNFRALSKRGWQYQVRLWKHTGKRWQSVYTRQIRRPDWKLRLAKNRLCRGTKGRLVVQMAIGRRLRGRWWNSVRRRYQKTFVPTKHQMHVLQCGTVIVKSRRAGRVRMRPARSRAVRGRINAVGRFGARRGAAKAGRYGNAWRGAGRYGNAWRGLGHFKARYGNAWRGVGKKKGRYGNAWRPKRKGRYGNAWRGAGKKKGRYGNAWRK